MTYKPQKSIKLDTALIEGFQKLYLLERFDNPSAPGQFHREIWEMVCSDHPRIAIAAPRNHAKSTSVTHTYGLALCLFRVRDYGIVVSDTEGQAKQFLHDIKVELLENEDLIRDFQIAGFDKESETEIIVRFQDGVRFCLVAKGSEQKVRGLKWRSKRPNFILGDDMENDEAVSNPDRREKFANWFFGALLPCGTKRTISRIVGTILHDESLLEKLLNDPNWLSRRYRAHKAFDDFSEILWIEQYDEQHFRQLRQQYIAQGKEDSYAKEYLNDPIPTARQFFKKEDFKDVDQSDFTSRKAYYCATDFAVSTKQRADRSVFLVASINSHGIVCVEEVRKGRWDTEELVKQWFQLHKDYSESGREIELYVVENGTIAKSIGPYLNDRMVRENVFLPLHMITPTNDKQKRAKAIQGRVKAGGVRVPKSADWFPDFEHECLRFPSGAHDDQVDAFAYIGLILDRIVQPPTDEELEEEEWQQAVLENRTGKNAVTGY